MIQTEILLQLFQQIYISSRMDLHFTHFKIQFLDKRRQSPIPTLDLSEPCTSGKDHQTSFYFSYFQPTLSFVSPLPTYL